MPDPEILSSSLTPTAPPLPNTIFRGPNGLRAGWRILIFLALVAALVFALGVGLRLLARANPRINVSQLTPVGLGLSEAALFLLTAIPALVMARIEHRKFGQYGLPAKFAFRRDFWIGGAVGFLAISGCLLGIFALHGFRLTGFAIHGSTMVASTAAWTAAFIMVGLGEEFSFRGYLQHTLSAGIGFWPSALLLSALFGYVHKNNPGESAFGLASVVLFGLLFCLFLRRTGNLWWAVGFHAGWDWGQTFFYGVPDSGIAPYHNLLNSAFRGPRWLTGGSVGPEASIFTPIVLAIVAIFFVRVYRENRYLMRTSDPGPQTSAAT
jgi:membrane protease YdiL (CAAX protease family)